MGADASSLHPFAAAGAAELPVGVPFDSQSHVSGETYA
jgi:hypothetical protein